MTCERSSLLIFNGCSHFFIWFNCILNEAGMHSRMPLQQGCPAWNPPGQDSSPVCMQVFAPFRKISGSGFPLWTISPPISIKMHRYRNGTAAVSLHIRLSCWNRRPLDLLLIFQDTDTVQSALFIQSVRCKLSRNLNQSAFSCMTS
jgi:hypothetical protein